MLLIGDSGSGKTGALASLADAGYNLRILDLDNGIDILANIIKDPKSPYKKESLDRVFYETVTDKMKNVNGKLMPAKATVWQRSMKLLDNWKTEEQDPQDATKKITTSDFGPITTWTPKDVLVLDSLTFLSTAALNLQLSMNSRLGQAPQQQDWYAGQQMIEGMLQMLYDEEVKCNVIVNCHITFIGDDNVQHGYPASLGKALPPKIGRYFNSMIMAKTTGSGANQKHKISTLSSPLVELKNTNPLRVKADYPLEFGLAEYFRDIRGEVAP
jgi:hypothetical protein